MTAGPSGMEVGTPWSEVAWPDCGGGEGGGARCGGGEFCASISTLDSRHKEARTTHCKLGRKRRLTDRVPVVQGVRYPDTDAMQLGAHTATGRFQCPFCPSIFARLEHQQRHTASIRAYRPFHSTAKPIVLILPPFRLR